MRDKVVDDASEMGAYMYQLLEYYLVGPQYSGYSGVKFLNITEIFFSVVTTTTPAPTGDGKSRSTTTGFTTTGKAAQAVSKPLHEQYWDYILYGGIGLILLCCCISCLIFYYCAKQRKIKNVKFLL